MVSVIVPAYNVEGYLSKCLDSLLKAVDAEDEIILTLGRSKDRTGETAEGYASRFDSVRLVEQNGRGLSNARNCGLDAAKGDYILFVDGDDYVDPDALKKLLGKIKQGDYSEDVVMTDFYRAFPDGRTQRISQIGERTLYGPESLPKILNDRRCFWNTWRSLYRAGFLKEKDIRFQENTCGEDIAFFVSVLLAGPDMIFVDAPFYYYLMDREGSLMNTASPDRIRQTVNVLESSIAALDSRAEKWARTAADRLRYEYILNMAQVRELEDARQGAAIFERHRQVLKPGRDPVVRGAEAFIRVFGIDAMTAVLAAAKGVKRKLEHRGSDT